MASRPDNSSRRTLGQLVRLAVCGLLLAVIFHAIFCNEAQIDLLAQGKPEAWNAMGRWEQRQYAWTHSPSSSWRWLAGWIPGVWDWPLVSAEP